MVVISGWEIFLFLELKACPTIEHVGINKSETLTFGLCLKLWNVGIIETTHVDACPLFHAWNVELKVVEQNAQIDISYNQVEWSLI